MRHKSSSRPFVYIFLYYSILPSLWYMSWKNYCDYSFQTICRPSVKTLDNGNVEPLWFWDLLPWGLCRAADQGRRSYRTSMMGSQVIDIRFRMVKFGWCGVRSYTFIWTYSYIFIYTNPYMKIYLCNIYVKIISRGKNIRG